MYALQDQIYKHMCSFDKTCNKMCVDVTDDLKSCRLYKSIVRKSKSPVCCPPCTHGHLCQKLAESCPFVSSKYCVCVSDNSSVAMVVPFLVAQSSCCISCYIM